MKKVSIVVCTYNGGERLKDCVNSILNQQWGNLEILFLDGGSTDGTLDILNEYRKRYSQIRIIKNKNKLPEGKGNGKWLGFKKAKGEIIGLIDQDNVLQRTDILKIAVKSLSNPDTLGVLGGLKHEFNEEPVIRYLSLFGTDSFFAYRSVDFLRNFWGLKKDPENKEINLINMPLTGGNCFFYNRKIVEGVGGYSQDVLLVRELLIIDKKILSIIKNATIHYSEDSFFKLIKKKFMWGRKYNQKKDERFNYYPNNFKELLSFGLNFIFCLTILPNLIISARLFLKTKDWVVFLFPPMAFLNLLAYGMGFILKK